MESYLDRRGIDAALLARPTRELLRRPLLAHMFVETGSTEIPEQAREVFLNYWGKLSPFEQGAVADLAVRLFRGELVYPIPAGKVENRDLQSLAEAGRWIRLDGERVQFLHDLLLTWAVAEGLRRSGLTEEDLEALHGSGFICKHVAEPRREILRHLGGLPAGLLWLLCRDREFDDAARILAAFNAHGYLNRHTRDQLDGLGHELLPAIERRLRMEDAKGNAPVAFGELVESYDDDEVGRWAVEVLGHPHPLVDELAARVLIRLPARQAMDALWSRVIQAETNNQRQTPREALLAAVALWPTWLGERLDEGALTTRQAISLLSGLKDEPGEWVWRHIKLRLFVAAETSDQGVLARAVATFRDREELDRIEGWLIGGQPSRLLMLQGLRALTVMDPPQALQRVEHLAGLDRGGRRPDPLDARHGPARTCGRAAGESLQLPTRPRWTGRSWCGPCPKSLSQQASLKGSSMPSIEELSVEGHEDRLASVLIRAVGSVCTWPLLDAAARRKGTPLEEKLWKMAQKEHRPNTTAANPSYEGVRALLLAIGGVGASRVMELELGGRGWNALRGGDAAAFSSEAVVQLVREFALGRRGAESHLFQDAAMVLARLGRADDVIDALLAVGPDLAGDSLLFELLTTPVSDAAYAHALEAARSTDEESASAGRIALALSRRPEAVQWLLAAPAEAQKLRWCHAYALRQLAQVDELRKLFIDALGDPVFRPRAVDALWNAGRETDGLLARHLLGARPGRPSMTSSSCGACNTRLTESLATVVGVVLNNGAMTWAPRR
ncbi:MAG: hypothetical protein R3F60_31245 [bacterium]